MGSKTRSLRHEGRPHCWSELGDAQHRAFKDILDQLLEAKRLLDEPRDDLPMGLLDFNRSARISFLAGSRGMGKTTVLLSLMYATGRLEWSKAWDAKEREDGKLHASDDHLGLRRDVEELRRSLIWLEPLDMDPLAEQTNLLAAILVRIEAVLKGTAEQRDGRCEDSLWLSDSESADSYRRAFAAFRELESGVARAWDGNLVDRGARIDPDLYSEEVLQAERSRLGLNSRLARALDDLAKVRGFRDNVTQPLLVLPIDDVDLNPLRGLEVLRILRMLSIPRLFTIVLGDDLVVEQLVRARAQGMYRHLAGVEMSALSTTGENWFKTQVSGASRKLIPPAQVTRLEPMSITEALGYPADLPKEDQLRSILHGLVKRTAETNSLIGGLIWLASERVWSDRYLATSCLNAPPREVADIWHSLHPLRNCDPANRDDRARLLGAIVRLARLAILSDGGVSGTREVFLTWFRQLEKGHSVRPPGRFVRMARAAEGPQEALLPSHDVDEMSFQPRYSVDGFWNWKSWASDVDKIDGSPQEPRTMGYLAIITDLIDTRQTLGEVDADADNLFCETQWASGPRTVSLPWPLPKMPRLAPRERFFNAFEALTLRRPVSIGEIVEALVESAIHATIGQSVLSAPLDKRALPDLVDILFREQGLAAAWASIWPLACCPELGIAPRLATSLGISRKNQKRWTRVASTIRSERTRRLTAVINAEPDLTSHNYSDNILKVVARLWAMAAPGAFERALKTLGVEPSEKWTEDAIVELGKFLRSKRGHLSNLPEGQQRQLNLLVAAYPGWVAGVNHPVNTILGGGLQANIEIDFLLRDLL